MKIYYKATEEDNSAGYMRSANDPIHKWIEYRVLEYPKFCCDDMEHWYDYGGDKEIQGDVIEFGESSPHLQVWFETKCEEGETVNIFFCPFCGEKIEPIEKERYKKIWNKKILDFEYIKINPKNGN